MNDEVEEEECSDFSGLHIKNLNHPVNTINTNNATNILKIQ